MPAREKQRIPGHPPPSRLFVPSQIPTVPSLFLTFLPRPRDLGASSPSTFHPSLRSPFPGLNWDGNEGSSPAPLPSQLGTTGTACSERIPLGSPGSGMSRRRKKPPCAWHHARHRSGSTNISVKNAGKGEQQSLKTSRLPPEASCDPSEIFQLGKCPQDRNPALIIMERLLFYANL